jgi:CBS domain-containing protein
MYEFLKYTVKDVMTRNPFTTSPDRPLRELEEIFETHDFNGVPVIDHGRLVGMLTKYDLLRAFIFTTETLVPPYDEIMAKPVGSVMTVHPFTVTPDLPLSRLLQELVEMQTKSFPVVEDGDRLVGIISRDDVLRALRRAAVNHQLPEQENPV